VLVEEVGFI